VDLFWIYIGAGLIPAWLLVTFLRKGRQPQPTDPKNPGKSRIVSDPSGREIRKKAPSSKDSFETRKNRSKPGEGTLSVRFVPDMSGFHTYVVHFDSPHARANGLMRVKTSNETIYLQISDGEGSVTFTQATVGEVAIGMIAADQGDGDQYYESSAQVPRHLVI
jgi:hypothetical protein